MGNLARSGYGATEDGLVPYSYDTCDNAMLQGQGLGDGSSTLPQQRLSCVPFETFTFCINVPFFFSVHVHVPPSEPAENTLVRLATRRTHRLVVVRHRSIFLVI
jgi:hypothetical protein